ncbi:ty3-gypsy retrotransposon protein [Tanacetum coccineum]
MRLDVPKFSVLDPDSWIFAITEYFTLLNTPVDQRLRVVGFNLEGDAVEWFRWMSRNKLITTWGGFLESVQNRFGPCKYEDPQGALSKLLKKGTVAQYQSEFEKLMNHVTNVSEGLLISFYIFGLKPSIQRELLVSKPASLGGAFSLARVTKARLKDLVTLTTSSGLVSSSQTKCLGKFLLLMTDDKDDTVKDSKEDVVESGTAHVLIDNGSTYNFVWLDVVEKICLPVQSSKPFKVYIEMDLYVLPRKGPDIVLGIQWLQNLGKVTHDYLNQTMEFSWSGRDYALKGEEQVVKLSNDEHEGQLVEQPLAIFDTLIVLQKGIPVRQVLVQ